MKKVMKNILQLVLVLGLSLAVLLQVNEILEPKNTYRNGEWPTTASYNQFYAMEDNSIDVLFLGSSYAETSFVPQVLYDEYGIRSYNLACEQQSIFLSYFWLKEALQTQSPSVVVVDCRFLFSFHPESPINTLEGIARICLDPMKYGSVKQEAIDAITALDESQSKLSYYLTNLRFHERWTELTQIDFDKDLYTSSSLLGYAPILDNAITSYTPFISTDTSVYDSMDTLMVEYMDKIVALCQENGIELVMTSVPSGNMTNGIHNTLSAYADQHGVRYLNLSEESHFNAIGAVFPNESAVDHENVYGAQKTSRYVGQYLVNEFGLSSVQDAQYESFSTAWNQILNDELLVQCTDLHTYLSNLAGYEYTVLLAVNDDTVAAMTPQIQQDLTNLGFIMDFTGQYQKSWYGVVSKGSVLTENSSMSGISSEGRTGDGLSVWSILSQGRQAGSNCSINIDGEEHAINTHGLNIVVYDEILGRVIDSVVFDTSTDGHAARVAE